MVVGVGRCRETVALRRVPRVVVVNFLKLSAKETASLLVGERMGRHVVYQGGVPRVKGREGEGVQWSAMFS